MMRRFALILGIAWWTAAYGQPNNEGFVPGHIFVSELESGCCCRGKDADSFIREIDPRTGESWILAGPPDEFCVPNGLRFTPDGRRLRVLVYKTHLVMAFDPAGNGTIIYDSDDGVSLPLGQNGLAFDALGSFYVVNDGNFRILQFPGDTSPPMVFADLDDGIVGRAGLDFASNGDLFVTNGSYAVLRITPLGVSSVFDTFEGNDSPVTLEFDRAGNLFVGVAVSGPDERIYRYDDGLLENKRLLASGFEYSQFALTVSADQRDLYVVDYFTVWAVDAEDGTKRVIFEFPRDWPNESSGGLGITVYIPPVPGDLNADEVVDLSDYAVFLGCVNGPDYPFPPPGCTDLQFAHADLQFDHDVDFADFALLQEAIKGP